MRRTLTVLVTAAAFLVPASAASADVVEVPGSNASCSNGKGGNLAKTGAHYNGKGNTVRAVVECGDDVVKGGHGKPEVFGPEVPRENVKPETPALGNGGGGSDNEEPKDAT